MPVSTLSWQKLLLIGDICDLTFSLGSLAYIISRSWKQQIRLVNCCSSSCSLPLNTNSGVFNLHNMMKQKVCICGAISLRIHNLSCKSQRKPLSLYFMSFTLFETKQKSNHKPSKYQNKGILDRGYGFQWIKEVIFQFLSPKK